MYTGKLVPRINVSYLFLFARRKLQKRITGLIREDETAGKIVGRARPVTLTLSGVANFIEDILARNTSRWGCTSRVGQRVSGPGKLCRAVTLDG